MDSPGITHNRSARTVNNYEKLRQLAQAMQGVGHKIVVTIGTYDLIHIGHARYLEEAKSRGDILIVGVDSDRAVKIYKKDESRPMVPEVERLEMLLHLRCVDYVTLIDDVNDQGEWQYGLLKAVGPDVFVAVEDSYPKDQVEEIQTFCGGVEVLSRQATTSTSEQIRRTLITQIS